MPGGEQGCQVGFEVAAGAGTGAGVVEAPYTPVGEDAPSDAAVRRALGRREVSDDLAVRRSCTDVASALVLVADVEREPEALALLDRRGMPEALRWLRFLGSHLLGSGIGKEQMVGNVLVAYPLLGQVVRPTQELEDGADQVFFGLGFIGGLEMAECLVT